MRTAQMCDIWRSVWRSDPRLVCVLGAQAAWSFSATEALKCPYWTQGAPCSGHAIDAVAVAPYMGGAVPSAWTSQPDGGLANLFQSLYSQNDPASDDGSYFSRFLRRWSRSATMVPAGGFIAQDAAWEQDFITNLAPYKLPSFGVRRRTDLCERFDRRAQQSLYGGQPRSANGPGVYTVFSAMENRRWTALHVLQRCRSREQVRLLGRP